MDIKHSINNFVSKFAVEIEGDYFKKALLEETINKATEPLAPSYAERYLDKFKFLINSPLTIYNRPAHSNEWIKNQDIFRHLCITQEHSLRPAGIFGMILPFNKVRSEITFFGDKTINAIPLEERTLYGLKHKSYSHQNSNLINITDELLAIKTPTYHVQTGKPEYDNTIIILNK